MVGCTLAICAHTVYDNCTIRSKIWALMFIQGSLMIRRRKEETKQMTRWELKQLRFNLNSLYRDKCPLILCTAKYNINISHHCVVSSTDKGHILPVPLLPRSLPLQGHWEGRPRLPVISTFHSIQYFLLQWNELKCTNAEYAMLNTDCVLYVFVCYSPGDRITVLDDSNEEWWRVSLTLWLIWISVASVCSEKGPFLSLCVLVVYQSLCCGWTQSMFALFSGKDGR